MTTQGHTGGRAARSTEQGDERRVLVIAAERCVGAELVDDLRRRLGTGPARLRVVAPALVSRLRFWASDEDPGRAAAADRLGASLSECRTAGIELEGAVGDPDPLQAIDDEVRSFGPDEIVVATHPRDHENWLERDLVPQARARFDLPITHVVVDAATGTDTFVPAASEPKAHARERHHTRDVAIGAVMTLLAVVGTLISLLLYESDASTALLATWVLVMDLGLKLALIVGLWTLFLRRGRADRLDY